MFNEKIVSVIEAKRPLVLEEITDYTHLPEIVINCWIKEIFIKAIYNNKHPYKQFYFDQKEYRKFADVMLEYCVRRSINKESICSKCPNIDSCNPRKELHKRPFVNKDKDGLYTEWYRGCGKGNFLHRFEIGVLRTRPLETGVYNFMMELRELFGKNYIFRAKWKQKKILEVFYEYHPDDDTEWENWG